MADKFYLSDTDKRLLKAAITSVNQKAIEGNRYPNSLPDTPNVDTNASPEMYVALTTSEITAAVIYNSEIITPGTGTVEAHYLNKRSSNVFSKVSNLKFTVWNITDSTIASGTWVKIEKDSFGTWVVDTPFISPQTSSWKSPSVVAATVTSGTLTTSFENGDTIDGVVLSTGDRILIKNQSSPSENGIYTVNSSGTPTRATDADTGAEIVASVVVVTNGTVNADSIWLCTTNATITVGSTSLLWIKVHPMLSGSSTGSTTFGLSTGAFEDVGHSIVLPEAGTYLVTARETAQGSMTTIPGFSSGEWTMRLYDVTNSAAVPNTITTVMNISVTGKAQQQSATVTAIITVTGPTTIRTEGKIGLTGSQVY